MNVVDSSAWLEYFAGGPNAGFFAPAIENTRELVVPTICILEVFRVIRRQRPLEDAVQRVAHLRLGRVVPLDECLALQAAALGVQWKLPLADSIVLATAEAHCAIVWTQDADFAHLPRVKFRAKAK